MIPRGNHATDMIEAADRNYEWQERREWERAHLPPPGDGVEKDNASADLRRKENDGHEEKRG